MGNCHTITPIKDMDFHALNYHEELQHFYVICVVLNPAKSSALTKLYLNFKKQMETEGVKLVTVECTFGKSPFVITRDNYEPDNIQIRSTNSFFQKENLINIAIYKLPKDAKYVVWVDCDMEFLNTNWTKDTINALNRYRAVQLYEEMILTDENGKEKEREKGFTFQLCDKKTNELFGRTFEESTLMAKYAWGFRYETLKQMKGLIDFSPIGNNSKIMAHCFRQNAEKYVPSNMSLVFREAIERWQTRTELTIDNKIGYISGAIKMPLSKLKQDEKMEDNWRILQTNGFDQLNDMYKDEQGLYCLEKHKPDLIRELKEFYDFVNKEGNFVL